MDLWYYNTRMDDLKLGCLEVQKITNFYPISLWLGNRRVTVLLNNEFKYRKERALCFMSFLFKLRRAGQIQAIIYLLHLTPFNLKLHNISSRDSCCM